MFCTGHGVLTEVSEDNFVVEGRAGSLHLWFSEILEYEISGHYPLRKDELPDLYFARVKRVRDLIFRSAASEAHLIFPVSLQD